jgi:glucokinase
MTRIVSIDLGGTHARFAFAEVSGGRVVRVDAPTTLKVADHASLADAWAAFGQQVGETLPRLAAIAVASPVTDENLLKLTNNPWTIRKSEIDGSLGLDRHILINDFEAVGHAVAHCDASDFQHLAGPDEALPAEGAISIVGPGTGLGVALLLRSPGGYHVQTSEGGHAGFAPSDDLDDDILHIARGRHGRVSVERIVAGPGLPFIYQALMARMGAQGDIPDHKTLWQRAQSGEDDVAVAAAEHFCWLLGTAAGDIVLTHGSAALVIAGGLGLRIKDMLLRSDFQRSFADKGRFVAMMRGIPVKIITHAEPGLLGAAAAFAVRYPD